MTYIPPASTVAVTNLDELRLVLTEMRDWLVEIRAKLDNVKTYEQNGMLPFQCDYSSNTYDATNNATITTYRVGGPNGTITAVYRYTYDALGNMLTQQRLPS